MFIPSDKPWAIDAACLWVPYGYMFPEETDTPGIKAALALCNGDKAERTLPCPVREECLDYALRTHQEYGIWGGKTEAWRRKARRHRKASA